MRYHELLIEEVSATVDSETYFRMKALKHGISIIKKNCQPYLSQVEDPMKLRRGVSRNYKADPINGRPQFGKKQGHLTGREPLGGPMRTHHDAVNKYFTSEFGYPFRNGILSTGDQMMASGFGTDVAIFPIGEFKFLWSPSVEDLNQQISIEWAAFRLDAAPESVERLIIGLISEIGYQTTDLQAAIESKNEIMIWAEEYYTLDNSIDRMLVKKLLK